MRDTDIDYVRSRYLKRIATMGITHDSLNSGTEAKQGIRHGVHAMLVGPDDAVLDFGCGLGDFYRFIRARGHRGRYVGIDIVPEYVDHCVATFPEARFVLSRTFLDAVVDDYDVVVASQVFNARYPDSDNRQVLETWLRTVFSRARKAVTFDVLSDQADWNVPDLYYYSPLDLFSLAKTLTRFVSLRHDYLPFEFAIHAFRESTSKPGT